MKKYTWLCGLLFTICTIIITIGSPTLACAEEESNPTENDLVIAQTITSASDESSAINQNAENNAATGVSSADSHPTSSENATQASSGQTDEDNPNVLTTSSTLQESTAPAAPQTVAGSQAALSEIHATQETVTTETQDMYRLYNPNSGEHFYTGSAYERDYLDSVGWNYEGVGWTAPVYSDYPVYRLYNPNAGDHHYTTSAGEKDHLVAVGWNYEGIGWYSAPSGEGIPVLRQYNPNATTGAHNFTMSVVENQFLVSIDWNYESIAWYATKATTKVVESTTSTPIATAPYLAATFTTTSGGVPETIVSYAKDDTTYLFFPSYTPLNAIFLKALNANGANVNLYIYNNGTYSQVNPDTSINLTALGGTVDSNSSIHLSFKAGTANYVFPLVIMKSANISAVYINSSDVRAQGRAFVEASSDHSAKAKIAVSMVNSNGEVVYNSDDLSNSKKISTIKGRGNSSWGNGIKKPYQISLSTKGELVNGAGKAKKWILLANSADASLLHSSAVFDLAAELGLSTVDSTPVDLYYDGEYRGSYLLAEKVQIDKNRVDIVDLEDAIEDANPGVNLDVLPTEVAVNRFGNQIQYVKDVADPSDISGGYLIELDNGYYGTEKCWFTIKWPQSNDITHFVVKSPEVASYNAIRYISEAVQEALNNLAQNKTNLADGSFSFDLDSFSKMFLIEEFTKNIDAYVSSTFFYLDAGSTVIMSGPVWDFDAGMGTRTDASDSLQNTYSGIYIFMARNATFCNSVKERIVDLYKNTFSGLIKNVLLGSTQAVGAKNKLHSISWYANRIAASQRMNEIPFGVTSFGFQASPFATWDLNVEYFSKWLSWRVDWFNNNIDNIGNSALTNFVHVYDGVDYGPVYDYEYYLEQNPDIAAAFTDPVSVLKHFIIYGMAEGRTASRNFDLQAYRNRNPKLQEYFGDNSIAYYYHYCTNGFKEGLACWA